MTYNVNRHRYQILFKIINSLEDIIKKKKKEKYTWNQSQSFSDDEVQATGANRRPDAQYKLDESNWPLHVQLLH